MSKVVVHGPSMLTIKDDNRVCSCCGQPMEVETTMYVGRIAGKHVRTCSEGCFSKLIESQETLQVA